MKRTTINELFKKISYKELNEDTNLNKGAGMA